MTTPLQTYVVCDKCQRLNRVRVETDKTPVCGECKAELPIHGAVVDGSDRSLPTLIRKSSLPVIVDVWAPWCAPCRAFAPTFEEFSTRYAGKAVFVKLNSETNQQSAGSLGIRSIPSIIVFKNGSEVTRQSGAIPRDRFSQWLDQFI